MVNNNGGNGLFDTYLLAQALGWNWDFGTVIILGYVLPFIIFVVFVVGFIILSLYFDYRRY